MISALLFWAPLSPCVHVWREHRKKTKTSGFGGNPQTQMFWGRVWAGVFGHSLSRAPAPRLSQQELACTLVHLDYCYQQRSPACPLKYVEHCRKMHKWHVDGVLHASFSFPVNKAALTHTFSDQHFRCSVQKALDGTSCIAPSRCAASPSHASPRRTRDARTPAKSYRVCPAIATSGTSAGGIGDATTYLIMFPSLRRAQSCKRLHPETSRDHDPGS